MKTLATLKEVILLLQQHNIQPFKQNGQLSEKKSKLEALYEGIADNTLSSDEEAMLALYGAAAENSTYRKLKSDLQERLMNLVLTINFDYYHYSDYQKSYYECHKQWVTIRFLIGQNANMAGLMLAQRLLRQSERFDFTLLSMDIASYLRVQYGLRESNDKRFKEANGLFKLYQDIYMAECMAEELYTSLVVQTVNNRAASASVNNLAIEYFNQVSVEMQKYESYKLQMYGYMIGIMGYTTANDYSSALKLCSEAIHFFKQRPYEPRVPLQIFYYQQLLANIQLQQLEDANITIVQSLELLEEGTFNWFKFNELYFILLMHVKKYAEAGILLFETINHARFEFLPDNAKELWRIYESYIHYLILLGKIQNPSNYKFKLGKFINEVPIFSKDKGGMNIAILAIKFLYLLLDHKYSRVIDEAEPMEQYCYRHLRHKNTKRSYAFLKILVQIPHCQFNVEKFVPKAQQYLDQLKKAPLQLANQTYEIEIIPYEQLWSFAVESLSIVSPKTE